MANNPWPQGLSPQKRAEILAALKVTRNAAQVARDIPGVSYMTIYNIAKAEKIDLAYGGVRGGRPPVTEAPPKPPTQPPLQIPSETRDQIIAALKSDHRPTVAVIARQAGLRRRDVFRIANEEKIKIKAQVNGGSDAIAAAEPRVENPRGQFAPLVPGQATQIIEALKLNPNATQVAREVGGVSRTSVSKIAKAAGIELTAGKEIQRRIMGPKLSTPPTVRASSATEGNNIGQLLVAVSAIVKKSVADAFKTQAELFGGVARNMPNSEFRNELSKLVERFDSKPSGAG